MQKDPNILELEVRLIILETTLQKIQRRRKLWYRAVLVAAALCASFTLYAQTSQGALTLQSLAERLSDLEKRVANDEASGANIPQQAGDDVTPKAGKPASGSTTSSSNNAALEQRINQLENSVSAVQSQVSSLESGSGTGTAKGMSSTVVAPFKVVDQAGHNILYIGKALAGNGNDLLLYNPAGLPVDEIAAGNGLAYIYLSDSNDASVNLGVLPGEHASVAVTERSAHATTSTYGGAKPLGLYLGAQEGSDDQVGSFSVTKDGNGSQLQINSASGSAIIGAPSSKSFGLRFYPGAATASPNAGIVEDGQNSATIGISENGKWIAAIEKKGNTGIVGVLDGSGQKYVSALTNYNGGGGALQIANPSGQIVSLVDADPKTNEGRAVFTDTGGQPLAKIGVAGTKGDVQIFGEGKGFDLWTHMLTGLP